MEKFEKNDERLLSTLNNSEIYMVPEIHPGARVCHDLQTNKWIATFQQVGLLMLDADNLDAAIEEILERKFEWLVQLVLYTGYTVEESLKKGERVFGSETDKE